MQIRDADTSWFGPGAPLNFPAQPFGCDLPKDPLIGSTGPPTRLCGTPGRAAWYKRRTNGQTRGNAGTQGHGPTPAAAGTAAEPPNGVPLFVGMEARGGNLEGEHNGGSAS